MIARGEGAPKSLTPSRVEAALAPTPHSRGRHLWEKAGCLGEKSHAKGA